MEDEELSLEKELSEDDEVDEEEDDISWVSCIPSPRQPQFNVEGPFPFGRCDLEKLVQRNDKTRAVEAEVDASIKKMMKNANAYVLEMKLLDDIENILKDGLAKRQPLYVDMVNNLLEDDNWLKSYGLESSDELQETYSKIKQNILALGLDVPAVLEVDDLQEENLQEDAEQTKKNQFKRALPCLKQAINPRRPLSTGAIEGPSHFLPAVPNRRAKTCRVLPNAPKKGQSKSCWPRGFSSEEVLAIDGNELFHVTSSLESFSEDDEQYHWSLLDGGRSASPRRSQRELISVNNPPIT